MLSLQWVCDKRDKGKPTFQHKGYQFDKMGGVAIHPDFEMFLGM